MRDTLVPPPLGQRASVTSTLPTILAEPTLPHTRSIHANERCADALAGCSMQTTRADWHHTSRQPAASSPSRNEARTHALPLLAGCQLSRRTRRQRKVQ